MDVKTTLKNVASYSSNPCIFYYNKERFIVEYPTNLHTHNEVISRRYTVNINGREEHIEEKIYNGICIRKRKVKTSLVTSKVYVAMKAAFVQMTFKLKGEINYESKITKKLDTKVKEQEHQIYIVPQINGVLLPSELQESEDIELYLSFDFAKKHLSSSSFLMELVNIAQQEQQTLVLGKKTGKITYDIELLLKEIIENTIEDDYAKILIESKIKELFVKQIQNIKHYEKALSSKELKIESLKNYIDHNFTQDCSLKHLGLISGINISDLQKEFKLKFNETIHSYIVQKKMDYAKERLISSDDSILEITEELGYSYSQHFIKAFKKVYHITPLQYRMSKGRNKN